MPISILILKFPYSSLLGGGELQTISLVENLKKRGFDFYLVSSCHVLLSSFKKRSWPAKSIWLGVEPVTPWSAFVFPLFIPYLVFRLFFILFWYKIKHKTSVLYCLNLTEKLLATPLAFLLGYRVFWTEHLRLERWLLANPFRFLYVLNSRLARVIAVSRAVKKQLLELGIKPERAKVIYNGIDLKRIKHQESRIKNPKEKIIIGAACRLSLEKGLDDLIRAFALVLKKYQNVELWIAGRGPEKKNLENQASSLKIRGKVKFLGWQKDIFDFLNKIDVFALTPYRRESFGVAAAEAQATGIPVVGTDISGLSEVVEDGKTGFVLKARHPESIAAAILKLVGDLDLRQKMGEAGRTRVKKMFSLEKMLNEYKSEFKEN